MARGPVRIAACVKWVDLHPEVDHLHGVVTSVGHSGGFSAADTSAVEVALRLADAWGAQVVVLCAGPAAAEDGLRDLVAAGAARAARIEPAGDPTDAALGEHTAEEAATLLAGVLSDPELAADVVVCGDVSADLGSGAVPAYLAHHLGASQALGLVGVEPGEAGRVRVIRRLDGGRREVLDVEAPAVLSVEGGVAELRRASLAATLAVRDRPVDVLSGRPVRRNEPPRLRPWRPAARVIPAPVGEHALERIVALTGALVDRTPPRTVELDPPAAADAILDQLTAWGYLPEG